MPHPSHLLAGVGVTASCSERLFRNESGDPDPDSTAQGIPESYNLRSLIRNAPSSTPLANTIMAQKLSRAAQP